MKLILALLVLALTGCANMRVVATVEGELGTMRLMEDGTVVVVLDPIVINQSSK